MLDSTSTTYELFTRVCTSNNTITSQRLLSEVNHTTSICYRVWTMITASMDLIDSMRGAQQGLPAKCLQSFMSPQHSGPSWKIKTWERCCSMPIPGLVEMDGHRLKLWLLLRILIWLSTHHSRPMHICLLGGGGI